MDETEYRLEGWEQVDPEADGWHHFLGRVWHMTWPNPAQAIMREGTIEPSSGGRQFSQPQTANSYALRHGYVAVFDFRAAELDLIEDESMKWSQYFWGGPYRVGFSLDVTALRHELIGWNVAKHEEPPSMWIPYFEAWHPEQVPLSAADEVIVTSHGMLFSRKLKTEPDWAVLAREVRIIGDAVSDEFHRADLT